MKIGVDIDDVITKTSPMLLEYIEKYAKDEIDYNNPLTSKANILKGIFKTEPLKKFMKEYGTEIIELVETNENANEVISFLKNQGNEIYIITARCDELIPRAEEATKKYFEDKKIPYNKLHMGISDKKQLCNELGIDIMIDDSATTCQNLVGTSTTPVLFTTEINSEYEIPEVKRVNNWKELFKMLSREQEER